MQNNKPIILETDRLLLRKMTQDDLGALCKMLKDKEVMRAYEHAFSDEEAQAWLNRQLTRYSQDGFGLWAVVKKKTDDLIGQCGVTMQDCNGKQVPELGWHLRKDCWHQGFATEAALACRQYAFEKLGFDEVYAIIRDTNIPSQNVAKRVGMTRKGHMVKHYYGMDMPHLIFSVRKSDLN